MNPFVPLYFRTNRSSRFRCISGNRRACIDCGYFAITGAALVFVWGVSPKSSAADFTWTGASPFTGGNSNWSTAANWAGGVAPPNDGSADIIISGSQRFNPTVNTAWAINTLTFSSTAEAFTLGGQTLTLQSDGIVNPSPVIINSSTLAHTINNTLVFQNGGTINASTGDLTFGGSSLSSGGNTVTLSAAAGRTLTFNTILTGTGGFTKSGSGTAKILLGSIYTGTTNVSAGILELIGSINNSETVNLTGGTLRFMANERIASAAVVTMSSGSTLDLNGYTETFQRLSGTGTVTLGTGGSLIIQDNGSTSFSGLISGAGDFTKGGTGTLTLSGSNTYTGDTIISGGILAFGASNIIGNSSDVVVQANAALQLNNFSDTIYSLSGSGIVNLGTGTLTISGSLANHTFAGTFTGNGTFTKSGAGTQTLSGSMTGTSGTLNVSGGILNLSGTAAATTVNVSSTGQLRLLDTANRLSAEANVNLSASTSTLEIASQSQTIRTLTGTGLVNLSGGDLKVSTDSEFTFNGRVIGTGQELEIAGGGTMTWGGTGVSSYTGITRISGATTLKLAANERLPYQAHIMAFHSGSQFDLGGYTQTINGIFSEGQVKVNGNLILNPSVGLAQTSANYTGSGKIIKRGQTSSGLEFQANSTFDGELLVEEGTVNLFGSLTELGWFSVTGGALLTTSHMGGTGLRTRGNFEVNGTESARSHLELTGPSESVLESSGPSFIRGGRVTAGDFKIRNNSWLDVDSNGFLRSIGNFQNLWVEHGILEVSASDITASSLNVGSGQGAASVLMTNGGNLSITGSLVVQNGGIVEAGGGSGVTAISAASISASGTSIFSASTGASLVTHTGLGASGTSRVSLTSGTSLQIAHSQGRLSAGGAAEILVSDSSVVQNGTGTLAGLNVNDSALVRFVRSNATFFSLLGDGGEVIVEDSTVNFVNYDRTTPALNFLSGQIQFGEALEIGGYGPFGNHLDLTPLHSLLLRRGNTDHALTVAPNSVLSMTGGTLTAADVVNQGTILLNSGTLNLTGATTHLQIAEGGTFGPVLTLGANARLNVPNGSVSSGAGATLTVSGGILDTKALAVTGTLRASEGLTRVGSGGLSVAGSGRVFASGTVELSGTSTNLGRITLQDGTGLITGSTLANQGILGGDGEIASLVTNTATGDIRGENGRSLILSHASGLTNSGRITLQGGTVELAGALANTGSGALISGRGTLIAGGGITNSRAMAFSSGLTDIYGDVLNTGSIVTSGGAAAITTFYDDVVHNGTEIRTAAGSSTVFFGSLSGSGPFTGTGTVFVEGDMRPGNSPGIMSFGGDLILGPSSLTFMELGGSQQGSQYDALNVSGLFAPGGTLRVSMIDGFNAVAGMVFDLFDWGSRIGDFAAVELPSLLAGLKWNTTGFQIAGSIAVEAESMTYRQWRDGFAFVQPEDADPQADPDRDGMKNLIEYALGSHPLQPDANHPSVPRLEFVEHEGQTHAALTYLRPSAPGMRRSDLIETIVGSANPGGSWNAGDAHLHSQTDDGVWETLTYRASVPVTSGAFFLRLESTISTF